MAKQRRVEFTVEGSGFFPFDMLRYDACWPKSEGTDSVAIEQSTRIRHAGEVKRVTLQSDSPNAPTDGRWESFGWRVIEERSV